MESEFFNRWLVVGVPRGAAVGVTGAACSLSSLFITREASGAESQAVLAPSAVLSRCIILLTSQTCVPPLRPPTRLLAPIRDVRSRCPTACPLSSGATFHSHLSPVLSVSPFAPLLSTASTQIPLTLAVISCSALTRSGRTWKRWIFFPVLI